MSIEWKKGPPPKESGTWLVWSLSGSVNVAFRPDWWGDRRLWIVGVRPEDEPTEGWEASITHHCPHLITPPEEERPGWRYIWGMDHAPSPREGAEGDLVEGLCKALEDVLFMEFNPTCEHGTVGNDFCELCGRVALRTEEEQEEAEERLMAIGHYAAAQAILARARGEGA